MEALLSRVYKATEHFMTEKHIVIINGGIYVSIFSSNGSGFAKRVAPGQSPRVIEEFFSALERYDEQYYKEVL